jgi:valine dehydrogenase (NAD+)
MAVFSDAGHEQVVFCQDPPSGLRAIIAIYSTALGPALGGTRFYPYASEEAALADVLNLSKAMAYKAAVAGLDLGGGKAVIIGDPATDKTEQLLRAYDGWCRARRPLPRRRATSAPTSRTWTSSPATARS